MKSYILKKNFTIQRAIKLLNIQEIKCLVITDKNKKLIGTIMDGDLRRAIVKNKNALDENIEKVINKKPFIFKKKNIHDIKNFIKSKKIDKTIQLIPVVDKNLKLIKIINLDEFIKKKSYVNYPKKLELISVVIMAGGKGKRLEKFTELFPKPLLPYKNSTVLETIINKFKIAGVKNVYLTLNYKKNLIKSYINNKIDQINLDFIEEKKALGSAGAIAYLKTKMTKDFFLINCDTLANIDLEKVYKFHKNKKNDLTIIAANKNFSIPYGSCVLNKSGEFEKIVEKKNYVELINIGMYVFSPQIPKKMKLNSKINMDELIKKLKKLKMKIGVFPINENSWVDTGTLENIILKKF